MGQQFKKTKNNSHYPVFPVCLPWEGKDVPHITIEVNNCCNITCHGCYKDKNGHSKPLELVKEEIDIAVQLRNLSTMTIMGGEPTLYPQLDEVIRYISSKGIEPGFLTNGTLLSKESIKKYRDAGVKKIFIHIDSFQSNRPDVSEAGNEEELNKLREKYVNLCAEAGIETGLAITLYKRTLEEFNSILDFCYRTPGLSLMLVTDYSFKINQNSNIKDDGQSVDNDDVYRFMENEQKAYPVFYLPSSHNENALRWLIYSVAVTQNKGDVSKYYFKPSDRFLTKILPHVGKLIEGKYAMSHDYKKIEILLLFIGNLLMGFRPSNAVSMAKFLYKSVRNKNIKMLNMVFQEAATDLGNGEFETCRDCPDATIRNGKAIPICIADQLEPSFEPVAREHATNS